jgi:hypothetical protein
MQLNRNGMTLAALVFLVFASPGSKIAGQEQGPPAPKPGPEHAVLKEDVGTWDAKVEIIPAPGMQPMVSKGVETNTLGCGGLCLISDFKAEGAQGEPFHGHGITTWDPVKKKYVGSWTDSMSTGLMLGESTWDPAAKKATGTMTTRDPTGKPIETRMVAEYPSPDARTMMSYMMGPDGKEFMNMRITYTRRK